MHNNNQNKLVLGLGIFAILLLICLVILIWDRASIAEKYHNQASQYIQSQQSQYNQEILKSIKSSKMWTRDISKEEPQKKHIKNEIINPKNIKQDEESSNALINEINYLFNDQPEYANASTDLTTEEAINELMDEIEESENQETELDENFIKLSLEEDKFFVYMGYFNKEDAIRLINYLQYLNYKTLLKTSRNMNFVLVEFNEKTKADEFLSWAKENSFHNATIISK